MIGAAAGFNPKASPSVLSEGSVPLRQGEGAAERPPSKSAKGQSLGVFFMVLTGGDSENRV